MRNIKFEHILTVLVLVIILTALVVFRNDKEIVKEIIGVLTTGFTGMVAFFFTKYTPTNKSFVSSAPIVPLEIKPTGTITNDIK